MTVHCCIDAQTPARDGRTAGIRGWLFCDVPVVALVAESDPDLFQAATYGQERPDVGAAFPAFDTASRSGFFLESTVAAVAQPGHWWVRLATGDWYRLPVDWSCRHPKLTELTALTRQAAPPESLQRALVEEEDLEARVHRWMKRGPRLRLRLDLINKCNLRCIMCHYNNKAYAQKPVRKISLEEFQRFFEPLAPDVGEVLLSCADEPLLSPAFPEVLRYLAQKHPMCLCTFARTPC